MSLEGGASDLGGIWSPPSRLTAFSGSLLGEQSSCRVVTANGPLSFLGPNRHSALLDLMEELRPVLADRLALSLVNRRQLGAEDFAVEETGGVRLTEAGRKRVLVAWQERKREECATRSSTRRCRSASSAMPRRRCSPATCAATSTATPPSSGSEAAPC